ncbi:MAG: glutamate synthase, partial [Planctomycetota bacterium]
SHTDGGSFIYTLDQSKQVLTCADKFGKKVESVSDAKPEVTLFNQVAGTFPARDPVPPWRDGVPTGRGRFPSDGGLKTSATLTNVKTLQTIIQESDYPILSKALDNLVRSAGEDGLQFTETIETLTWLRDRFYPTGGKKRSSILAMIDKYLVNLFQSIPEIKKTNKKLPYLLAMQGDKINKNTSEKETLVIQATGFPPEGDDGVSRIIVEAYKNGWKKFIVFGLTGQRFCGCGLGADSDGVQIDLYGSSGDYTASGLDGAEIYIHNSAQDQIGQILKRGKLVIFGHVGQTFMYGAKGGEVYVLGNAAGRPLINGVGKPRVIINGTCLDYLAESFMAGDPLKGGGFAILNGLRFNDNGILEELETPYPGGNLFSLATGGAIYVRDPDRKVDQTQLHGGQFVPFTNDDWQLIKPYLEENERLFGISIKEHLLKANGQSPPMAGPAGPAKKPEEIYRKIRPALGEVMQTFTEDM